MSTRRENDSTTHSLKLEDGTELCIRADHGRGYVDVKPPRSRVWSTNRIEPAQLAHFGRRATEIADAAPSTKRGA